MSSTVWSVFGPEIVCICVCCYFHDWSMSVA